MARESKKRLPIRRRAIRLEQTPGHPLYLFSLTGEELLKLADISRVSRDDAGKLIGYQRAAVRQHVAEIVDYLNSDQPLFPNSLILALSSDVKFIRSRGPQVDDGLSTAGTVEFQVPRDGDRKPAWIVDGQQRALAISLSKRKDLPVAISAFVADKVEMQRDQFIRINNTKPLPKGLISELLPDVDSLLPPRLAAKKLPSALCDVLATHPQSPFVGLIRRTSMAAKEKEKTVITDTSLLKMLEESLTNFSGCLFPYRNLATGETDTDTILKILFAYWSAVRDVFPEAWGRPPTQSRLMHGAGIRAMGRLMDKVMGAVSINDKTAADHIRRELALVKPVAPWTAGRWDEEVGSLAWNEVQNVPKHISGLSNFLIRYYLRQKGVMA